MRRSDREVTDLQEIRKIMEKCDVCRLALNDEEFPYILPLNFGIETVGEQIVLYFHGAMEGTKYRLMEKNPKAGFEMDCAHSLVADEAKGYCTMEYESVIGRGILSEVLEDGKFHALDILVKHYHKDFRFSPDAMPRTRVLKLTVQELTGKRRKTAGRNVHMEG